MKRVPRIAALTALAAALVLAAVAGSASAVGAQPQGRAAAAAAGRVVVGLERGAEAKGLASARAKGGTLERTGGKGRFAVVKVPRGMTAEQFSAQLRDEAGIDHAAPQQVLSAALVPNDPQFSSQWGVSAINAPAAWDIERGDPSVVIAIIDSGVDLAHSDLATNVDTVNDRDFVNADDVAQDDNGHGTHVAGIAAAVTDNGLDVAGVANGATILPLKVLDNLGDGYDSDVAEAIYWAANNGADVINLSLGGTTPSQVISDAIDYALALDCVVVAAAGNSANTGYPPVLYPAADAGVIAVGATNSTDGHPAFSNYGPELDIAAPGVGIYSTQLGGGTTSMQGTSMATPHVAGAAALLRSQFPTWTNIEIEGRLLVSAKDIGAVGRDNYFGVGLLDTVAALTSTGVLPAADDEIPGVVLPASPVVGSLDLTADTDDVYAASLLAGQSLTVTMVEDAGADFELRMYGPGTQNIQGVPRASNSWGMMYVAPVNGTYYLDVRALSGAGGYTLQWSKSQVATVLNLTDGSSTCSWGGPAGLVGNLRDYASSGAVSGHTVAIDEKPNGATGWTQVATAITDQSGEFSVVVYPSRSGQFRARFEPTADRTGDISTARIIQPFAALSRPSVPTRVVHGVAFTSRGTLTPRHPGGSRTVKISAYRYERGKWVLKKYTYATNYSYAQYSKYSARVSLPSRGSWKLVSSVAANSRHAATQSAPRYVWVK